ncbi:MAG TPA: glucose 1-dehydrogenase [Candidatus Polarisedimenticolia bacterium]|nr:glucose 1-dehydrogenase [Candidatus Polarisedimenticolia bacterium]
MRAIAVVPGRKEVKVVDHKEPSIAAPTDVKLRVLEVGVCGTDREICSFQYGTPPDGSEYLVIGHESLGEVMEVGARVTRLRRGDLVVPTVRRPCPHANCAACRAGRRDFCYTGDFTERGIKQAHGFMTEVVVDDETYMNVVPRGLREVAVLVEPLTIAEKALLQVGQIQQRLPWTCPAHPGERADHCHRAVVLGAGPVGLLGAMALRVAGFNTFVYSREGAGDPKARLVESIGAGYVSAADCPVADLARKLGNIDLVYEATGASQLAFQVINVLGTNGIFVFTGVPGRKGPVSIDTDLMMRNLVLKNQVLFGTVNAGKEAFEAAVRDLGIFMQRFPAAVKSMITGRHPIQAHRDLLLGPLSGIKNVINFG